jgi:hypothetical protein
MLFLVCSLSQSVFAEDPDSGWWWNADESGRGFAIERQGDTIFFAAFLYDDSSFPTWFTATLKKNSQQTYVGTLQQFQGGQTLTGSFQKPIVLDENAGDITLDFSDSSNGTLNWPGGTIAITRFSFSSNDSTDTSQKPERVWWWNADESGRGFALELQGNTIFFAAFLYDESDSPTWYTAILNKNAQQDFVGVLQQFQGGQTLLGSFQAPSVLNENAGAIKLNFSDTNNGTIVWPGGTVPITRFIFASDDSSSDDSSDDSSTGDSSDVSSINDSSDDSSIDGSSDDSNIGDSSDASSTDASSDDSSSDDSDDDSDDDNSGRGRNRR